MYEEFKENIVRREDGWYEVRMPWISWGISSETNEQASNCKSRLANVERKLSKDRIFRENV